MADKKRPAAKPAADKKTASKALTKGRPAKATAGIASAIESAQATPILAAASMAEAAQKSEPANGEFLTPAGLQPKRELMWRRIFVAALNVVTWLWLANWMASILGAGGWSVVDYIMLACFLIGTPWSVLGFWNAIIGLWLLMFVKDPMKETAPYLAAGDTTDRIGIRTAVFMTLRNEDPERALKRFDIIRESTNATGQGHAFGWFVLSDTPDGTEAAEKEEAAFNAWKKSRGNPADLIYRRRTENVGYKAGNVRDFCERWGDQYELMLPLDADSLMSGASIVKLVRIMEAYPKLGLLQSLVVGMPSQSAFARIFQFGMRHGMRSYTMGQSWWVGDCGPFWGHNAVVRIKPFRDECHLPILPGKPPLGGHILSHDQVEATFMRRAGYECRVLPLEMGSYEENPPTILDFTKRDTRWCQGNMQYWSLISTPGLKPMSRFQLAWAILMFLGTPAWTLFIALSAVKPFMADASMFPATSAIALYLVYLGMYLSPKIAGFIDILASGTESARYGGRLKFLAGALVELVFSFLLGAVATFRITIFMIGLLFGRTVTWNGQARDAYGLPWDVAMQGLWPQLVFGIGIMLLSFVGAPGLFWWGLPMTLGYVLAVPLAVYTANPATGTAFARMKLCAIPEEFREPEELTALKSAATPVAA
jgi:membrane glycosyltransferase